jgi:hypothetical protein
MSEARLAEQHEFAAGETTQRFVESLDEASRLNLLRELLCEVLPKLDKERVVLDHAGNVVGYLFPAHRGLELLARQDLANVTEEALNASQPTHTVAEAIKMLQGR